VEEGPVARFPVPGRAVKHGKSWFRKKLVQEEMAGRVECTHPRDERLEKVSGRVECTHPRGERLEEVSDRVECTRPRGERLEVLSGRVECTHPRRTTRRLVRPRRVHAAPGAGGSKKFLTA
jgi:hypothetical protein